MTSYRFRRRAFLSALGGGLGLKIILRNLEASAQGMKSPGRLLVAHWPVGIVAGAGDTLWKPTAGSVGGSPGLKPFADAGLGPDMTVLRGLSTLDLPTPGAGGPEGGTVTLMTGIGAGGTRANCCEGDDAFAAPGGSFDQLLLEGVPALRQRGGSANSIVDSRTDRAELSTQCLSYSTTTATVQLYNGGTGTQAKPLMPVLSPLLQYMNLFDKLVPGDGSGGAAAGIGGAGGARPVADAMLRQLVRRKSVLDFAVDELNQMKAMAPSSARSKLDIHTTAILDAEGALLRTINARYPETGPIGGPAGAGNNVAACGAACTKPAAPSRSGSGLADPPTGMGTGDSYGRPEAEMDDAPMHETAGKAHLQVLKAAFICDLIRVGTFQWSPGSNHVGFALFPDTTQPFQHHPTSHRIGTRETTVATLTPTAQFLLNVQLWYFARVAETMADWKRSVDGCGNPLLDSTVVPFLTETRACGHERTNIPGMLIGGKALGFTHNLYRTDALPINDLWASVGQALGHPGGAPFGTPVPGIWTKPA